MIIKIKKPIIDSIFIDNKLESCFHGYKIEEVEIYDEEIMKIGKHYFKLMNGGCDGGYINS